jgi:hypothetical protein
MSNTLDIEMLLDKISKLEQENSSLKQRKRNLFVDAFQAIGVYTGEIIFISFYLLAAFFISLFIFSMINNQALNSYYTKYCFQNSKPGIVAYQEIDWWVDKEISPCFVEEDNLDKVVELMEKNRLFFNQKIKIEDEHVR